MAADDTALPSDQRRMVTIDKMPVLRLGEVVTYATTDHEKLQALAAAAPDGVDYQATWDLLEKATGYECVLLGRRKKQDKLDTFSDERQARAYVRGMLKMAELLAPKIEKLKAGVKAGL